MKITNDHGFPTLLVRAVERDPYDSGDSDYTVTTLIKPPQMVALEREHWGELTQDVSERIWALSGQAKHYILSLAAGDKDVVEKRFFAMVHCDGRPVRVSGQVDILESHDGAWRLTDVKETSVWSVKDALNGGKPEWDAQLNMLAWLCGLNRFSVTKIQIMTLCRDWRRGESKRYNNYPRPSDLIPRPLWDRTAQEDYIHERLRMHLSSPPPPCSDLDRWKRPDQWAVMKKGRKSALRLLDSQSAAEEYIGTSGGDYIDFRPGGFSRCEEYCAVSDYCPQWAQTEKKKEV